MPVANAVLSCKEELIKFVHVFAVTFQSLQSGAGWGIALELGNISFLMVHSHFSSKP